MDVRIRQGAPADAEKVLAVWAAADAEPTVTDDLAALRQLLDHDPEALLVAEAGGPDGEVVGTLLATWDGWRASLWRLAVRPDHRRRAVARALVHRAEERFVRLGARRIATFVVTTDATPTAFWSALGYEAQTARRRFVKNLDGATA